MQIRSVGIDLGKTTFHLVALSAAGKVLIPAQFVKCCGRESCSARNEVLVGLRAIRKLSRCASKVSLLASSGRSCQ
jgi:hypothetical protein